jgi:hypothetical protein
MNRYIKAEEDLHYGKVCVLFSNACTKTPTLLQFELFRSLQRTYLLIHHFHILFISSTNELKN